MLIHHHLPEGVAISPALIKKVIHEWSGRTLSCKIVCPVLCCYVMMILKDVDQVEATGRTKTLEMMIVII